MKICKECGIEKEDTEFFRKKEKWLEGKCKKCKRVKAREKELENYDVHKEKERLRNLERNNTEERKKWREENRKNNKEIIALRSQKYRDKNKQRLHEKAKEWQEHNKKSFKNSIKEWRKRNPEKVRAQKMLNYHIDKGHMTRAVLCSRCNIECHTHAHHEDYLKPLDVKWLCRSCHGYLHRKIKD